jgi:hypothetical protein
MKNLLILPVLLIAANCSTIVNGTTQEIAFVNPPEHCTIDGEAITDNIEWRRTKDGLTIVCHIAPEITKEAVVSAVLIDFGAVDAATGAMWVLPAEINLEKLGEM